MAIISYRTMSGEVPRLEPHLLPQNSAQLASFCDFSSSALQPLKDGALLGAMVNNPVRGIYSNDGLLFYTWPVETLAFSSPIFEDPYPRVYFLSPSAGIFSAVSTTGMASNGPSPTGAVRAGVPRPTTAPVLSIIERTTLPDYPNVTVSAEAWWESAGTAYGRGSTTITPSNAFHTYDVTNPAKPGGTPDSAILVVKLSITDNDNSNLEILGVTVRSGSATTSNALPGGVEVELSDEDGVSSILTLTWGLETRAYTYVYTNTWDEVGPPAPPSTIDVTYLQDERIALTAGTFTGYRPFYSYEVYRTYGGNSTFIQTDVTLISGTTYSDASRVPGSVGIALESSDWLPAPTGLGGAAYMPGGWFAVFKGQTLYMSEPYRPHAFPYNVTFKTVIRGVCASAGGLVVTTADGVFFLSGQFPASVGAPIQLDVPQPGIAQRSMVNVDGAVAYASHDGIVFVSGTSGTMAASQRLWTRASWQAAYTTILADASMRFAFYDGALIATSNRTSGPLGFVLRLDEEVGALTQVPVAYESTFFLPALDSLYYSVGANVYKYQTGANRTFDWWSRDWLFPSHVTFGAGRIKCSGTVTLRLYAEDEDGAMQLVHTGSVVSGDIRLPDLPSSARWSVRLGSNNKIERLVLARSFYEMKYVQ